MLNRQILDKISLPVKATISFIFTVSAIGKLIDPNAAALSFILLLPMSPQIAKFSVFILSIFEAGLAIIIWRRVYSILLFVPIVFWAMLLLSYFRGVNCGCFGSLPFFSHISIIGHFLLLPGIFLGLYYLAALQETTAKTEKENIEVQKPPRSLKWVGVSASVLMLAAFLPLPIPAAKNQAMLSTNNTVDRAYVEATLFYQNATIIDARPLFQFELGHIPGALNIPYNSNEIPALIEKHDLRDKPLIVYCSSARCNVAHILAEKLQNFGCKNVRVYPGGWEEWRGYHTKKTAKSF